MDSKKKYDQMVEDGEIQPTRAKYIWVLDFEVAYGFVIWLKNKKLI